MPTPAATSAASTEVTKTTPSIPFHRFGTWLFDLASRPQPSSPTLRRREYYIRYYLRRAKEPAVGQRRKSKRDLPPRPQNVADLCAHCRNIALSLALLTLSIAFIACYSLLPAFRIGLGSSEALTCSIAVVALLAAAIVLIFSTIEVWRVHCDARKYAEFVAAMVDDKGRFNIKATDDSDYAEYIQAFGEGSIIIVQREFYDWFVGGRPPVRQVPTGNVHVDAV